MSRYDDDADALFDECEYCGNFNFQCTCQDNGETEEEIEDDEP